MLDAVQEGNFPVTCAYRFENGSQCAQYSAVDSSLCPTHRDLVFAQKREDLCADPFCLAEALSGRAYCSEHQKQRNNQGIGNEVLNLANKLAESDRSQRDAEKKRVFVTGATRDTNINKLEYRRFFSPEVLKRRAEYMNKHRKMADGSLREPDNWKAGMPQDVYLDSLVRHVQELNLMTNGPSVPHWPDYEETICAIMFNAEGLLYEHLKSGRGKTDARANNPVDNRSNRSSGDPGGSYSSFS